MDLLTQRRFLPLFLTQFFGAFNDNAFKLAMLTLISYHLSQSQTQSEALQAIAGALFTLPFFLFSATAGQLADKFDKALLVKIIKISEIILMGLGSFALLRGSIVWMMVVLTGMGIHSTFFGPIKYAILPESLPHTRLLQATGLIEASTFFAILTGTILGALAISDQSFQVSHAIVLINGVAVIGFISSLYIPSGVSHHSVDYKIDWRVWRATLTMLKTVKDNPPIWLVILTISWFWLIGAVTLTKLPDYTHYTLGADNHVFALFLALFSTGIATGSLVICRFLKGKVTLRFVPISMLLLSVFAFDLFWVSPLSHNNPQLINLSSFLANIAYWRITIDFFLFSFCGGLFIVPLYTYLQVNSEEVMRARTIAANNIYNALAMVIGTLLVMLMLRLNFSIASVFAVLAGSNAIAALILWIFFSLTQDLN